MSDRSNMIYISIPTEGRDRDKDTCLDQTFWTIQHTGRNPSKKRHDCIYLYCLLLLQFLQKNQNGKLTKSDQYVHLITMSDQF